MRGKRILKWYMRSSMFFLCIVFSKLEVYSEGQQITIESVNWNRKVPGSKMTILISAKSEVPISLIHCRVSCEKIEGNITTNREFWKEESPMEQREDERYVCEFQFLPFGRAAIEAWAMDETGQRTETVCQILGEIEEEKREYHPSTTMTAERQEEQNSEQKTEQVETTTKKEIVTQGEMQDKTEEVHNQDKKKPKIVIEGIAPFMNLRKAVSIDVEIEDENLDSRQSEILLIQKKKQREITPTYEQAEEERVRVQYLDLKEDGEYELKIRAKDRTGNEAKRRLTFFLNQIGTKFEVISNIKPYMRERPVVQILLENLNPVSVISCTVNGKTVEYQYKKKKLIFPTTVWREGRQRIDLMVRDGAGNVSKMSPLQFVLDQTKPEILVRGVEENQIYYGERKVEMLTKNEEDEIYSVLLNKKRIPSFAEKEKNRVCFFVKEYQRYELKIRARDLAGNKSERQIQFQIKPYHIIEKRRLSIPHTAYFLSVIFTVFAGILIKKGVGLE